MCPASQGCCSIILWSFQSGTAGCGCHSIAAVESGIALTSFLLVMAENVLGKTHICKWVLSGCPICLPIWGISVP